VNESGCDVEGPSVLESMKDTHFVLAERVVLGERFLDLASCKDDVDCASKATAIREGKPFALEFSFSFTSRESEDVLGGMAAGGGGIGASEGMCARSYSEHRLSMREDGSVRLESRTTALPETPAHDNQCWFEPAAMKREAQGRPCTELTVIEATPAP
jgi:hypothetical protein